MTTDRCPKCQGTRIDPTTGGQCGCGPSQAGAGPAWTAGPWRVGADLTGICIGWPGEEGSPSPECFSKNGYAKTIAKVTHSPWADVTEHVANARLISAAPDLYEALDVFLADYVAMVNSGDCGNWNPEAEPKVIAARAALAKARGQ